MQNGDSQNGPQQNMLLLKRPTPVLRGLSFTHFFRDSVEAGGGSVLGWTVNWSGHAVFSQTLSQASRMLKLVLKGCGIAREGVAKFQPLTLTRLRLSDQLV